MSVKNKHNHFVPFFSVKFMFSNGIDVVLALMKTFLRMISASLITFEPFVLYIFLY